MTHRFCVAPMLDWTNRYCRVFHRLLSRHARLYTEMVTTGALLHGDVARHLDFDVCEQPVALQLGGSEPDDLARCAVLAQQWGYVEVNLNCGCPSERVQRGAFGACLMAEPQLVAAGYKAMQAAVDIPITIKHRIGLNDDIGYAQVAGFVETIAAAGCRTFIVHARNAVLAGLSPKENRDIPPLRYDVVYRLKQDYPALNIVLNGGILTVDDALRHLVQVDGVMLGRAAYHDPWLLSSVDACFFGDPVGEASREAVLKQLADYGQRNNMPMSLFVRHVLGLCHGMQGARAWRRLLSDKATLTTNDWSVLWRDFPVVR